MSGTFVTPYHHLHRKHHEKTSKLLSQLIHLQMGWCEPPPFLSAVTETTIENIIEYLIHTSLELSEHSM